MTKEIKKYEPKLLVQFYDKRKSYIDAKHKAAFMKIIKTEKFVEIDGIVWNTREIKFVQEMNEANRTKALGKLWNAPK
jgi:hypothetical protein